MKSIGIIRRIDSLGRVVIPREIINEMSLKLTDEKERGSHMEIFVNGEDIILRKYNPGCHCCNNVTELTTILGLKLCPSCLLEFKKAIKKLHGGDENRS